VVALNCFDRVLHHRVDDVREAAHIDQQNVPVVTLRRPGPRVHQETLITLVEHAMHQRCRPSGLVGPHRTVA